MESAPNPNTGGNLSPQETEPLNPNYQQSFIAYESRRNRARRWTQERISRERTRLGMLMAVAHSAVHLTLRNERNPRVRNTVRKQLEQRYGLKRTPLWWNY